MKYLVLGVWHNEQNQVLTHSKEIQLDSENIKNCFEKIICNLCVNGMSRNDLWEVFVFENSQNNQSAPQIVAHWICWDDCELEDEHLALLC